ncbi:uncharacterized protein LOC133886536 [Phragmites australis]|uniref:uncharacterized protein LOC133886536 n=1 Tax=Phragmites australis TaxID=29695 RepID=UPI002D7867E1|nr:uncharacterized protein LOC133886536 [Phragmites australis]
METAAVWGPREFQLANLTMEPAVWAPGLPVAIFGGCLQTSVPSSGGGQLVEHAAATQNDPIEKPAQEFEVGLEMKIQNPIHVFEKAAHEFDADIDMMKVKMHRYPSNIGALGEWHTVPMVVAIGPYHHDREHLKQAEKVKHVAAYHCIRDSGHSVQETYDAVVSVAHDARSLYDKDVVAGIGDDDFLPMMFYDACFLVQYMLSCTPTGSEEMDPSLRSFLDSNDRDIVHDVMLLENQLPWRVVETVMRFRPVPLEEFFTCLKRCLQDRKVREKEPFVLDDSYQPPHLLGLLRFYIVGRSNTKRPPKPETESISFSVSAIELAEIGITLAANKTTELIHMGVKKKGPIFAELSLAPLSLDDARASWLVNMAALELCTIPRFEDAEDEESAVCSYLLLLDMFVDREEDVHELRTKHLLQGGGGLTNKEALDFFRSLQGLRLGSCYVRVMEEIENYRVKRRMWIKVHAFVYKNMRTIVMVISAIGALVGIFGTIRSLKVHAH